LINIISGEEYKVSIETIILYKELMKKESMTSLKRNISGGNLIVI
jgi:hypothetical protein